MKTNKKRGASAKYSASGEKSSMKSESQKKKIESGAQGQPIAPPRLLRDTKGTAAALALLEAGIKFIYQKEFKKARAEFKNLMESHPGESEILARARSYVQICDREDPAHKKPAVANDQLYALGVIEHNRGNYGAAISCFSQSLEKHPRADYIYYSMAASMAMKGDATEAILNLQKAIGLDEDNRVYAKNDEDFSSLHALKEFADLVGLNPSSRDEAQ
jgi:tetratricopeptide (TPR) repeat protein